LEDESGDEKANLKLTENGETEAIAPKQEQKEVLLCLRPIRDGDKVDESLRFAPLTMPLESLKDQLVSASVDGGNNLDDKADSDKASSNQSTSRASGSSSNDMNKKRPPKKRLLLATSVGTFSGSNSNEEPSQKRTKTDGKSKSSGNTSDTEKSVVESLMLMNKSKSSQ
jgi:hypothetical protein